VRIKGRGNEDKEGVKARVCRNKEIINELHLVEEELYEVSSTTTKEYDCIW